MLCRSDGAGNKNVDELSFIYTRALFNALNQNKKNDLRNRTTAPREAKKH